MIGIGNKFYYIDLTKLFEYLIYDKTEGKQTEVTIDYELTNSSIEPRYQTVKNITSEEKLQYDAVKYEVIINFINVILNSDINIDGQLGLDLSFKNNAPVNFIIAFNTLLYLGFIKEL